jgi:hypothetical protein
MMGVRMPEKCWAVSKRQVMKLRSCCIWLVDSFENTLEAVHITKRRHHKCYKINRTGWPQQGQVELADPNTARRKGTMTFVPAELSRDRMSIRIAHSIFVRNSLKTPPTWKTKKMSEKANGETVLKWTCRRVHHHVTPKLDGIALNV